METLWAHGELLGLVQAAGLGSVSLPSTALLSHLSPPRFISSKPRHCCGNVLSPISTLPPKPPPRPSRFTDRSPPFFLVGAFVCMLPKEHMFQPGALCSQSRVICGKPWWLRGKESAC